MLIRILAATGLLALGTGLAPAQSAGPGTSTPAPAPSTPPAAGGAAMPTSPANSDMKEWQVAKAAKIGLPQALSAAESQGEEKGGRAIDADFERADNEDPAHYSVKVVYPSGKLVEYGINADSGELYTTENQPIERYFTRLKPDDFNNAKTPLKDALAAAERKAGGGKAYEAEVEKDGSAVRYQIKVAGADAEQTVTIGPDGVVVD